MIAFTVIVPHLRNSGNDAALKVALDCLIDNTVNAFTLTVCIGGGEDLYPKLNRMVAEAQTECIVISSSDIFMAQAWDVPMLAAFDATTWVNGIVAEPGAMGVHPANVHGDFGSRPESFRRAAFEAWANEQPIPSGDGWVVPLMVSRSGWLAMGGLDERMGREKDADGFPYWAADEDLIRRWKEAGNHVRRVPSWAFHLQRYSSETEQRKGERT